MSRDRTPLPLGASRLPKAQVQGLVLRPVRCNEGRVPSSLPTSWPQPQELSAPIVTATDAGVAVTLVDLKRLWIRHQALGPFRMDYDGRRPMVVFLFTPARSRVTGERFPRGVFSLLTPGAPVTLESAEPVETLAVAFASPAAAGLPHQERGQKTVDPGVRALAHEIRREMLTEGEAAMAYLEQLADSLIVRALMV